MQTIIFQRSQVLAQEDPVIWFLGISEQKDRAVQMYSLA